MLRVAEHRLDLRSAGLILVFAACLLAAGSLPAQNRSPSPAPAPAAPVSPVPDGTTQAPSEPASSDAKQSSDTTAAEVTSHDTAPTFRVRVNEVLVRVVVRTELGKVVSDLKKEDFQLFDSRKQQTITSFRVENPETNVVKSQ